MTDPPSSKRRWLLLLLVVAPLLPLWRCLIFGDAIGPFDQIRQMAPWNGPKPDRPWDVLQADGVLQFYVWRDLVFDAWGKGLLPFWNPYVLAGTPLMGNSQSAALYPPHVLLGLLHVPTGLAMFLLAWGHLAWAGLGTHALVRRLGGSRIGGILAGLMFSLSPFMVAWTGLPSVIETVSWIPWILTGVVAMFGRHPFLRLDNTDPNKNPDAAYGMKLSKFRRQYARATIGLAISVAMMILSGHLQFVAYGFLAAVIMLAVLALSKRGTADGQVEGPAAKSNSVFEPTRSVARSLGSIKVEAATRVLACLLIGGALAAPQLLPVLNYSQFSHRRVPPTADGYGKYVAGAVKPFELGSMPQANLVGHPAHFAEVEGQDKQYSSYWPQFVKIGANFAESAIYIGPLALSLLFLAPWRRNRSSLAPIALVGLIALLLATGTILNAVLYYGVPGWAATGSPGRVECLFVLAASVIAGIAVGQMPPLPSTGYRRFVPLLLPAILVVPFLVLLKQYSAEPNLAEAVGTFASGALSSAGPGLLIAIVVSAAALASAHHLNRPLSRALVLAAPVILFFAWGGFDLLRTGDPSFLKTSPVAVADPSQRIAVVTGPWDTVAAAPALAPPNTLAAARLHDLAGYDSLLHRDTLEMLRAIDGKDPATPANGNMMFVSASADPQRLADAGVTEVWTRSEMPQLGQPASAESGFARYRLQGPGRASTPAGPATIESEGPTQLRVKATGPGRLTVRDRNMPGWMVKVDGKHADLEGTLWREVDLPAGEHTVEFNYVPPGFMTGVALAFAATVLILAVFIPTLRRQKPIDGANPAPRESQ